jgi:MFS transporter, UMF1 family
MGSTKNNKRADNDGDLCDTARQLHRRRANGGLYLRYLLGEKAMTTQKQELSTETRLLRRKRWAWYFYDFGNSAYAAVVLLAVYSAYFQGTVVGGAQGSRLWGLSVGVAMFIVAAISPVLGAIADFSRSKKQFLIGFTAVACVFTAALFFVQKGDIFIGILFFILAEIGYRGGQVFYDAMLPEIANEHDIGRISGYGWALGSAGGVLCLLIILPLIMIFPGPFMVRISFIITAAYYALSSLPIFLTIKQESLPQPPVGETYLTLGFRRIWTTIKAARKYHDFLKFVISFVVYNSGVMMAMNFAAIIGAVLFGMQQTELIAFVILVQVTNVVGAYLLGHLVDRIGAKPAMVLSIMLMVAAVGWMFVAQTMLTFFFVGALAGFAMAGIQSISRTMVGALSPAGQSAEFYGFFAVAGTLSSVAGPAIFGAVAYRMAVWYQNVQGLTELAAEQAGQRVAVLGMAVALLLGLAVLASVSQSRARATYRLAVKS